MDQHFKLKFSIFFEFMLKIKNYFKKIVRIGNNPAFEKKTMKISGLANKKHIIKGLKKSEVNFREGPV